MSDTEKALAKVPPAEMQPVDESRITEEAVTTIVHNIEMLEKMVRLILREGQDYGIIPGSQRKRPSLWDGGAASIRAGFKSYTIPHVLERVDDGEHIRYIMRADVVRTRTGQVWASGVGSASSREIQYAYRWVENPEEYGHVRADLPKRERGKMITYRIPNPEIEDLENTLLKMAAKRAEVDATLQLPGVARVFTQDLREIPEAIVPCNNKLKDGGLCGVKTFVFKGDKMRGHNTGERDAAGKEIWHRQRIVVEESADAPVPQAEAPAGVVAAIPAPVAQVPEIVPVPGETTPKSIAEMMQRAKTELKLPWAEARQVIGDPGMIVDIPAAWAKLLAESDRVRKGG